MSEVVHALVCPECGPAVPQADARVCPEHGLALLTPAAAAKLDEAPLLGQVLDAKYALVDLIGGGGYGSVYRALQQPLGRPVALKVLHGLALNLKIGRERFESEAQALARLQSPHTVRLIDYGVTREGPIGVRNLPYLVMELIEGEDLEARLRRGSLSLAEVLDVVDGLVDALSEAHATGIVHRDLKPANVLLTRTHTGKVVAKVIDFGIARIDGANKSQSGFVTGTPAYMAPEQVRGDALLDARVDVYALAAMCFELLTGRPPYTGNDPVAVMTQHCVAAVPAPEAVSDDPGMRRVLAAVVRGLAKERDDRPESVLAFAVALRQAIADAPDAAPTPPMPALHSAPTALRVETPLTLSNLQVASPTSAHPSLVTAPRRARVGALVLGVAAIAGLGALWIGAGPARPPDTGEPGLAATTAVGVAMPAPPASVAVDSKSAAPSAAPKAAPTAAASEPAVLVSAAPGAARVAPEPAPKPLRPVPRSTPPAPDKPDAVELARRAASIDADLENCRCGAVERALTALATLPGGASLATTRRARLAACRPVDIDHRCVAGRLVEVQ